MHQQHSSSVSTVPTLPRVRSSVVLAAFLALVLVACSDETPPPAPATAPATAPAQAPADTVTTTTPETAAAEVPVESEAELAARADAAVSEQRLFAPAGDNAFELYIRVTEVNPENRFANNAISDLFPYAVMHVEQRLAANDAEEATRVLGLMEEANPDAPAMPRLRKSVQDIGARRAAIEAAEIARAERAAQQAADAAAAAAAAAASASAPPPATRETPPVAAPTPTPAETQPAAPDPVVEAPPPPRSVPAGLPKVLKTAQPRYPSLAARRGIEGLVELNFTVQPDGSVTNVEVVRSEPSNIFNREAVSAMQQWRFEAAPQASRGTRIFDFKLKSD